jgi:Acetyltransferase (GNAT) domain
MNQAHQDRLTVESGQPRWISEPRQALDGSAFLQSWRQRVAKAGAGSIYLHPDFLLFSPRKRESLIYVRPGADHDAGAFASLAAFCPKSIHIGRKDILPGLLSLRGMMLWANQFLGSSDRASARAFVDDLVRWLNARQTGVECIYIEDLEVDSPLRTALDEVGAEGRASVWCPSQPEPHWWVEFPQPAKDYWKRFSGKSWSDVRSKARKLKHRVATFTRAEQVPEFLAKAHEVSKQSWQARRLGLRMTNTPEQKWFYDFLAAQGALRSYILEQDGKPLAFECGIQWGGCFTFEETGYDRAYAQQSPGMVLMLRVLEDLVARDAPALCDFGYGDAPYKRLFGTRQTASGPVMLVRRGLRPAAVLGLQKLGRGLIRGSRAALNRIRLLTRLRSRYRK